jgi:ankyrin repeat protein
MKKLTLSLLMMFCASLIFAEEVQGEINNFNCQSQKNWDEFLIESILSDDLQKVRQAIACGVDINASDGYGRTALICAAYEGHLEMVELLLSDERLDINASDGYEWTALMYAASKGHLEMVELLLSDERLDINASDDNGWTALMWAAYLKHSDVAKLLKKKSSYRGVFDYLIFPEEVQGEITNLNCLSPKNWNEFLIKSILSDDLQKVRQAIACGADINASDDYGRTALMWAAHKGHLEMVELLLSDERLDINASDDSEWTALMCAASKGHLEMVKLLLSDEHLDINASDDNGRTALMWAAYLEHSDVAELLKKKSSYRGVFDYLIFKYPVHIINGFSAVVLPTLYIIYKIYTHRNTAPAVPVQIPQAVQIPQGNT